MKPEWLIVSECDILVSKLLGFETIQIVGMVSVSVSKNFGFKKSIGIGFEKNWYWKKYRYRFRKILVSKKVSVSENLVSVLKIFGIEKNIGFKKFGIQKVSDSENTFEEIQLSHSRFLKMIWGGQHFELYSPRIARQAIVHYCTLSLSDLWVTRQSKQTLNGQYPTG